MAPKKRTKDREVGGKKYVGRGALKLISAAQYFNLNFKGKICADVGCSTGGFTEVMLENGAVKVYAIDVGYGELDWKLRKDPRVIVMERTNARYLESLPEKPNVVTIDVSFISLKKIIPVSAKWVDHGTDIIALVKPQFEAEKGDVAKGGVVNDPAVHKKVLIDVLSWCEEQKYTLKGLCVSGLEGTKGNKEFFLWIRQGEGDSIPAMSLLENLKL